MSSLNSIIQKSGSVNSRNGAYSPYRSSPTVLYSNKIGSHLKSTAPQLHQKSGKKMITAMVHDTFTKERRSTSHTNTLFELFHEVYQSEINYFYFKDYKQLLRYQYVKDELYCILIPQELLQSCEQFVQMQRKTINNKTKILLLCVFQNQNKFKESQTSQDKKKIKQTNFIFHFRETDQKYPQNTIDIINFHLRNLIVSQKRIVRRWASNHGPERNRNKERKIHFFCEKVVFDILTGYKTKPNFPKIQVDQFHLLQDVLILNDNTRTSPYKQQILTSKQSNLRNSQISQTQSIYFPLLQSDIKQNTILSRKNGQEYQDQYNCLKIIICYSYHDQIKKIRAFVNTKKKDWLLWEISESASDVISRLEQFFEKKESDLYEQSKIQNLGKKDLQITHSIQKKKSQNQNEKKQNKIQQYWDIQTDEKIYIFRNQKDWTSSSMVKVIQQQLQNNQDKRYLSANYIIFKDLSAIQQIIRSQSSVNKYYIVLNEQLSSPVKQKINTIIRKQYLKNYYIKILSVKPLGSSFKNSYQKIAKQICQTKVIPAVFSSIIPMIIIDRTTSDYYYFLDKYSNLQKKFSFKQINNRQDLVDILQKTFQHNQFNKDQNKQKIQQKNEFGPIIQNEIKLYIIVKNVQDLNNYMDYYKNNIYFNLINFILQQKQENISEKNPKIIFKGSGKLQIQFFIQNLFRRETQLLLHNSIGRIGHCYLIIFNILIDQQIFINKTQIKKWESLNCKILHINDYAQLQAMISKQEGQFIYIIHSLAQNQKMSQLCSSHPHIKRIIHTGNHKDYNFRYMDEQKIITNKNQIFYGINSFEINSFLKYLRYNIKTSKIMLKKNLQHQFIFIYIQKQYKLNEEIIKKLQEQNDSIIIKNNGFQIQELPLLLQSAEQQPNNHIFIGDQFISESVCNHNNKYHQNFRLIKIKISQSNNTIKDNNCLLQTTEMQECSVLMRNLPENRYKCIWDMKIKTNIYLNIQEKQLSQFSQQLKRIKQNVPQGILQIFQYKKLEGLEPIPFQNNYILIQTLDQYKWLNNNNIHSSFSFLVINLSTYKQKQKHHQKYNQRIIFTIRKKIQFKYFFHQLTNISSSSNLQPINYKINSSQNIHKILSNFISQEIPKKNITLKLLPPFKPKQECNNLIPVQFSPMLDLQVPTLLGKQQYKPDSNIPRVLGFDILNQIKQKAAKYTILYPKIDTNRSPFGSSFGSKDDFISFMPLPLPYQAFPKSTLALLYPDSSQFSTICQILRQDLQKGPYEITMIQFSSKQKLQDFSKNNCEKLQPYKKIVLFLSSSYKKYTQYLNSLQLKLNNRLEYFILSDNFCNINHSRLKQHLPLYKISNYQLPYQTKILPKFFYLVGQYMILTPSNLKTRYQLLINHFVRIIQYQKIQQINIHLQTKNTYVIVVTNHQNYHLLKFIIKNSPTCSLIVDSQTTLAQDQFHFYKISHYTIYYGNDGTSFLQKILPEKPSKQPLQSKYLYHRKEEIDFIADIKYTDYQKKQYNCWDQLYHFLVILQRGESNWLLRVFNQAHTAVSLQPIVYMEKHLYMKQFKYFSQQSHDSALSFWDLPETYYQSQLSLASKLQSEQAPSIVLYNKNNEKWISNLKLKHNDRFKWFCVQDEGWIDEQGNLNNGTDMLKLLTKVKLFNQFFNGKTLSSYNKSVYFLLNFSSQNLITFNKTVKITQKQLMIKNQKEIIDFFEIHPYMMVVVFIQVGQQFPLMLLGIEREAKGRMKLINVKNAFVDDSQKIYIKFSEIVPVIKNLQRIQKSGKKVFLICQTGQGKSKIKGLLTQKNLTQFQQKQYRNIRPDFQIIASNIRGIYKKIYLICFQDQKKDIDIIFNNYGIEQTNVQYILLKRNKSKKIQDPEKKEESQCHCSCENRDQNQLAIESGPHSCIKQNDTNQVTETAEDVCRGNLPIESSQHLQGKKTKMLNIQDYTSIVIVYQQNLDMESKKQLLVACSKNDKIRPILYNSISQLKVLKEDSKTLMLLMMKQIPMQLFTELVQKHRQSIVFTTTLVKAIVPKYTDIVLSSVTSLFELANSPSIKKLKIDQVNKYLKKQQDGSATTTPQLSIIQQQYGLQKNSSTQKLNLTSAMSDEKSMQQQMLKLRKSLNGNLLVMLVDFGKRNKFTILAVKYHFLIQSYAGDVILENQIRQRNKHSILCIINRMMLPKLQSLKEKYPNVYFFLQHSKNSQITQTKDKRFLAGQFLKQSEFQKLIAQLAKQNQKIMESNPESAVLFNSDIKGQNNNSPNRSNFHYQSMINVEGRKLKVNSVTVTNRFASTQPLQDQSLKKGGNNTKVKAKAIQKSNKQMRNNQYYQN